MGISELDIKNWAIVGGYLGLEVPSILKNYPNVHVDIFECSPRYVDQLSNKFSRNPRVTVIKSAVADSVGMKRFNETNLRGSGSLLELGKLAIDSYGAAETLKYEVKCTTLDIFYDCRSLDVLWIDVQGAEHLVLKGGANTLKNVRGVFVEVSHLPDLYKGGAIMTELNLVLMKSGFTLVLLGCDFNLTGNALYIRR